MLPIYSKIRFTEHDPHYGDMAELQKIIDAAMSYHQGQDPIEVLQTNSEIPSINQLAVETTLQECLRSLNYELPSSSLFSLTMSCTRGAVQKKLVLPIPNTKNKESFVMKATRLWNSALPDIATLENPVKAKEFTPASTTSSAEKSANLI